MNDVAANERNPRPRISLRSALLLMTIVGMAIVIVMFWREIGPLREEVRLLRNETGRLSIDDPSKTHVVEVHTDDDFHWKWRVYIPEGRGYRLQMSTQDIPAKGYPASNGMLVIQDAGEMWIEYRIQPRPDSPYWMDKLTTSNGAIGSSSQPWVQWKRRTGTGEGVGHETEAFEPGTDIIISRFRVSEKATSSDMIEDPSAGFMIWLEPTK